MMYDREKSDSATVALKPTNKAGQPAAELVEPRAGAEGNVSQQSTGRAQYRGTVSQALSAYGTLRGYCEVPFIHPRWEKLWGGRRRSWHLHRPHELMEVAPWPKSMISVEA